MKKILIGISLFCLLANPCWGQTDNLTIDATKAIPTTINPGGRVIISCHVTHTDGPESIDRVAAMVSYGKMNASYPMLYDDGTNGDATAGDGNFSLEITTLDSPGEATIVFSAVDKDHMEVNSEPVTFIIR